LLLSTEDDDISELEPTIDTYYICLRCLKKVKIGKHIDNCHPRFTRPIYGKHDRVIVQVTSDSPISEKRLCVRMAKASLDCKGYAKLSLHKGKWIWHGQPVRVFLLTEREEICSYIVMGRDQQQRDVVIDIFTIKEKRGKGNMRFLLLNALKSMNHRLDTVWFKVPLCETEWHFLESVSEQTGLRYRTHAYFL
jgi:hypothetical protein